jgi:hypothetical protein
MVGWGAAAFMLLLPLVAMQFTNEVRWTLSDFVFAAVLIGAVGVIFELTVRASSNWALRAGVAAALAAAFLIVWSNAAVGMIGSEDNSYNLLFVGVILIALIGAVVVRFRAQGMALVMTAAAAAQAGVALGGLSTDPRGAVLSAGLAGLWLLAAALFARSARDGTASAGPR